MLKKKNSLIEEELTRRKIIIPTNIKPYLVDEDIETLLNLPDIIASTIWMKIYNNKETTSNGLYAPTCPFCYIYSISYKADQLDCEHCSYGKNHGVCDEVEENEDDDPTTTWNWLTKKINHERVISDYKNIIDQIENKYIDKKDNIIEDLLNDGQHF